MPWYLQLDFLPSFSWKYFFPVHFFLSLLLTSRSSWSWRNVTSLKYKNTKYLWVWWSVMPTLILQIIAYHPQKRGETLRKCPSHAPNPFVRDVSCERERLGQMYKYDVGNITLLYPWSSWTSQRHLLVFLRVTQKTAQAMQIAGIQTLAFNSGSLMNFFTTFFDIFFC